MPLLFHKLNEHDDEHPLPVNESEHADIEMDNLGDGEEVDESHDFHEEVPSKLVYRHRRREVAFLVWAVIATFFCVMIMVIAIIAHPRNRNVNWCCINEEEVTKCKLMALKFKVERFRPSFECISGASLDDCVYRIDHDMADVMSISNSFLYKYRDILQPIMAEDYENDDFGSYFVAVVKKTDQSRNFTRASLSASHACVSDIELTTGYLFNNSIISEKPCQIPHSLAHIFGSNLCAPASTKLDGGCSSLETENHRDTLSTSIHKCIFNTRGPVVAFLDHLSVKKYFDLSANTTFELMCPNNTRAGLHDYKTCHLFWQPSNALVVSGKIRSGSDVDIPADVVEVLHVAQLYFGSHAHGKFNLFKSDGAKDLLFSDDTKKLLPLWMNCSAENYLGKGYMSFRSSFDCTNITDSFTSCMLPQYN